MSERVYVVYDTPHESMLACSLLEQLAQQEQALETAHQDLLNLMPGLLCQGAQVAYLESAEVTVATPEREDDGAISPRQPSFQCDPGMPSPTTLNTWLVYLAASQ